MYHYATLGKATRAKAIAQGIVRDVSAITGVSRSAVSRTLSLDTRRPNAAICKALDRWLIEQGLVKPQR